MTNHTQEKTREQQIQFIYGFILGLIINLALKLLKHNQTSKTSKKNSPNPNNINTYISLILKKISNQMLNKPKTNTSKTQKQRPATKNKSSQIAKFFTKSGKRIKKKHSQSDANHPKPTHPK